MPRIMLANFWHGFLGKRGVMSLPDKEQTHEEIVQ